MIEGARGKAGRAPAPPAASPEAAGDPTSRELWRALMALTLGGGGPARMHAVCQATDLTPGALKILLVLSDGPRPMRALVETFKHDPSYLTGVVDLLERHGLARREPNPTDRRAKNVALTDQGLALLTRAQDLLSEPPAYLSALGPEEQTQLLALLGRLVDAASPRIPAVLRPRIPATGDQAG